MSSSILNNMSVTVDATQENTALLMPKLQYRFRVSFSGFGGDTDTAELTKQVIDCSRPNLSFDQITLDVYNSRVYLAGKHTWEPITINIRDDVNATVQKFVGQQLQKQFDFYEQASAASGQDYKFTTTIEILDGGNGNQQAKLGTNGVLETFELFGCYVESANYNSLNYAESSPVTVTLNIRYDNAIQNKGGTGVGTSVARTVATLVTGSNSASSTPAEPDEEPDEEPAADNAGG